jgi:hypothetical protein
MQKYRNLIWLCLTAAMALAVNAQNTFPATGNVGVGYASPLNLLDVNGSIATTPSGGFWLNQSRTSGIADELSGGGSITFRTGDADDRMVITPGGLIGIGVMAPQTSLQVGAVGTGVGESNNRGLIMLQGGSDLNSGVNGLEFKASSYGSGYGWKILSADRGNGNTPLSLAYRANGAGWTELVTMRTDNGNVGIGTTAPGYSLDVSGKIHTNNSVVYPDGSSQTTAWTGVLCGGDYAESVDVTGDRTKYGPGDVLVIDSEGSGKFLKSSEPYSTAVLGIYSTKPGALGRRQTTPMSGDEVPMAMIGIVPTKVSAENGAIKPGDLLVTSSTPGYAMKGTDRNRLVGAVIGKAMGRLDSGTGVIEVGVTLQ